MLHGDQRLKCSRFLRSTRELILNIHKQLTHKIRKIRCTKVLNFDGTPIKKHNSKVCEKITSENHVDNIELMKKEKPHKHLLPVRNKPFKFQKSLDNADDQNNILPANIEPLNNGEKNSNMGTQIDKSVSTTGSFRSPYNTTLRSENHYKIGLPKDLIYYSTTNY